MICNAIQCYAFAMLCNAMCCTAMQCVCDAFAMFFCDALAPGFTTTTKCRGEEIFSHESQCLTITSTSELGSIKCDLTLLGGKNLDRQQNSNISRTPVLPTFPNQWPVEMNGWLCWPTKGQRACGTVCYQFDPGPRIGTTCYPKLT